MPPKFGTIPARPAPPPPVVNPYDMVEVRVGKEVTRARPFEVATDPNTGKQYPNRAATSCPSCGHGIYFDITQEQFLAGVPVSAGCENCKAGMDAPPTPLEDPFRNPLAEGLVTRTEIDPLYTDPAALKTQPRASAASRIAGRRKKADTPPVAPEPSPDAASDEEAAGPSGAASGPPDAKEKAGAAAPATRPTTDGGSGDAEAGDLVALLSDGAGDNPQDSPPAEGDIRLDAVDTGEEPEEV